MAVETVRAEWVRDHVFLLHDRNDFPVVMTQPQGVNGSDLLPMSLIGCAAWDIVDIMQKQREQITKLEVIAQCDREPEPPWRYLRIHVIYQLTGRNLSETRIQKAIELTETKYCSIYATLRACMELTSAYEVVSE